MARQQADADEVKWAVLWWDDSTGEEIMGLLLDGSTWPPTPATGVDVP